MKRIVLASLIVIAFICPVTAQDFTWIKGSTVSPQPGVYGTMGVAAPANNPGGRHGCVTWTDAAGNMWLFGGEGYAASTSTAAYMNDLWKYDPATNQWTWVRGANTINSMGSYGTLGVASPLNDPPAREFASGWIDNAGDLWLFGGEQGPPSRFNDLWKYNIANNEWTWVKGANTLNGLATYGTLGVPASANTPGARAGCAQWKDSSGDLWLGLGRGFVGSGFSGFLEDLWKYDVASNQWTWMAGSNATAMPPVYGTQGVPSTTNTPGGRDFPGYWIDANNKLYILGGRGLGYRSDLWRYDPSNSTWVWLKGPNVASVPGTYGTMGVEAPANNPGGRYTSASWSDKSGNLWLFGGNAWTNTSTAFPSPFNEANDLWKYNPCTNNWTWMKGTDLTQQPGIYGTQGVSAPANVPGGRFFNSWWTDAAGYFWLFGGEGYDGPATGRDHMEDLWKYRPVKDADSIFINPSPSLCSGQQATLTAHGSAGPFTTWMQGTISLGSGTVYASPPLTANSNPITYTYSAIMNCSFKPQPTLEVTVNPLPSIGISGSSLICVGSANSYTASGANTYTWSNTIVGSQSTYTGTGTTINVMVIGTSTAGCENNSSKTVTVNPLPVITATANKVFLCANRADLRTSTITASGANTFSFNNVPGSSTGTYSASTTGIHTITVQGQDANGCIGLTTVTLSFVICEVGIAENEGRRLFISVFPNPSTGYFEIDTRQLNGSSALKIYNMLGQEMLNKEIESEDLKLNVQFPAGQYIIQIHNKEKIYTSKLIIE